MKDLEIARELVMAGAPLFVAAPCTSDCGYRDHGPGEGHNGTGYHFPQGWQRTRPDVKVIDEWQPGYAMCMVMGHLFDALDKDVQNGGELGWVSLRNRLKLPGFPKVWGVARTPSGGEHHFISVTGLAKSNEGIPARGVDLQAEGSFVFLAPTVKRSKMTGEPQPYVWLEDPRVEEALEWAGIDESGRALIDSVNAMRDYKAKPAASETFDVEPERARSGEWTEEQFKAVCTRALLDLEKVRQGEGFNAALNSVSMLLGHGVPEFWTEDRARKIVEKSVLRSVNGWTSITGQDDKTITSGLRAGMREPYRRVEMVTEELGEAVEEVREQSAKERMKAKILSRSAMRDLPKPEWLIKGILQTNSEIWMIGESGSFKSFGVLDWAMHVVTGREWRGRRVKKARVLYVVAEGLKGVEGRMLAWEKVYNDGAEVSEGLDVYPEPVQVRGASNFGDIGLSTEWRALAEIVAEGGYQLVILDTQARMTLGLNENDNGQMGVYTEAVSLLRRTTNACVLTVHHTGRNGGDARGASAIDAAQDMEWKTARPAGKELAMEIRAEKNKDGDDTLVIPVRMKVVDIGVDEDGEPVTSLVLDPDVTPFESAQLGPSSQVEAESLTVEQWIDMALDLDTEMNGYTRAEVKRIVNQLRRRAGQDPVSDDTMKKTISRMVDRGALYAEGRSRVTREMPES
jgi:hypothetical protein